MIAATYVCLLPATLGLLACATAASAECAWCCGRKKNLQMRTTVLRHPGKSNDAVPGGTPPGRKVSGYDFCGAMTGPMAQLLAHNSQPGPNNANVKEVRTPPGLVIVILKGKRGEYGGQILTRFLCIPDTVDPRGPKVKLAPSGRPRWLVVYSWAGPACLRGRATPSSPPPRSRP